MLGLPLVGAAAAPKQTALNLPLRRPLKYSPHPPHHPAEGVSDAPFYRQVAAKTGGVHDLLIGGAVIYSSEVPAIRRQ